MQTTRHTVTNGAAQHKGPVPLQIGHHVNKRLGIPARPCGRPLAAYTIVGGQIVSTTATSPKPYSAPGVGLYPGISSTPDAQGVLPGRPRPMGATLDPLARGVNFAVTSSSATAVSLCLFDESDLQQGKVTREIQLDPRVHKTGDVWHVCVPAVDLPEGMLYGYRVVGPNQKSNQMSDLGHRFDKTTVVLDPYARTIISRRRYGELGPPLDYGSETTLGLMPTWPQAAAAVPSVKPSGFDWEGDQPLNLPMEQLVVYEMHVRAFTQGAEKNVGGKKGGGVGGVTAPGTYKGMVEKLDYLRELGVTAVELLPVHEHNELEYYTQIPNTDQYRFNFWGYSTVGFFAPMSRFSDAAARGGSGQDIQDEFKTLVRECHKRGIEVILDVVFNHTAEGNEKGPTLSFRGLDNRIYYMLAPGGEYYNYSGCGNTLNCNHPSVRQFIVDCLKYWVQEYHVDGFRFDLASILTRANSAWHPTPLEPARDEWGNPLPEANTGYMHDGAGHPTGTPLSDPPLVDAISEDPVLRNTKLIAEAWDCDGLNQVGAFPHFGGRWAEWNGSFRDVVRNFIKGSDGNWAGEFANALCGSPSIYASPDPPEHDWWGNNGGRKWRGGRPPTASINFVTAHDGFTLADLVSYNDKHNEANGENNNDGEQHNNSWNCGEEGPTNKWEVKRLRQRQMRNFAAALLLAQGVPMMTMGDEYGHTKNGNNNTYCHDSVLNWFNWEEAGKDTQGMLRFTKGLIKMRKQHSELQRTQWVTDRDIQWHGDQPNTPDWSETSRLVAFTLCDFRGGGLYVAFNTSHLPRVVTLPRWGGIVWQQVIDTSKIAPYDCLIPDADLSSADITAARASDAMWTQAHQYPMLPWSCIVLEAAPEAKSQVRRAVPPSKHKGSRKP